MTLYSTTIKTVEACYFTFFMSSASRYWPQRNCACAAGARIVLPYNEQYKILRIVWRKLRSRNTIDASMHMQY